jgi:hypothetical protein
VNTSENFYEMLSESRLIYSVEMWGLEKRYKKLATLVEHFVSKSYGEFQQSGSLN